MTDNVVTLPVIRIERDGEDMSDLVERAAAALAQHAQKPDEWIEYYRPAARAVVAALSRPAHGGWEVTDEMIDRATKAVITDLKHGNSHGCRIRWGTSPDNFNLDGHVDLDSLVRAALTAALHNTTQEKT